jgi:hypothetical protein
MPQDVTRREAARWGSRIQDDQPRRLTC